MHNLRQHIVYILGFALISGSVSLAQPIGMEEENWDTTTDENRYAGLSRKSGTLFRRTQEDTPAAQLAHAQDLHARERWRSAGSQYNALVHRWPDAEEAPLAQLALARVLHERGRYENAFREYQYLIEHYAGQFPYQTVLAEQLQAAKDVMELRRGQFLFLPGFKSPERALPLLRVVIANGPNWSAVPDIRLLLGKIHEDNEDYVDAVAAYEDVIVHHGNHAAARVAIFRKAVCLAHIANRHPRDEGRSRVALQALFAALRENLTPEQEQQAQQWIEALKDRLERLYLEQAEYYDTTVGNRAAALLSYQEFLRRFPRSAKGAFVTQRIQALEAEMTAGE